MNDFAIVTESTGDLSQKMAEELGLEITNLSYRFDTEGFDGPFENEAAAKKFYNRLRSGEVCTTSAINTQSWAERLETLLAEGKDVLCSCFSSGLSSTHENCVSAAEELRGKYPGRKILVSDTLAASMGQGLISYHLSKLREEGKTIEETHKWLEDNKLKLCHWFTVDDLMFLKRGGRLSGASAVIGTILHIKPVLHVDDEGHLVNVDKARGRKASLKALVENMEETVVDPQNQVIFISHGDCLEDAEYVAAQVKERLNVKEVVINYISPVVGCHSGPGTVALFFLGTKR